jgi:hypothetical protein
MTAGTNQLAGLIGTFHETNSGKLGGTLYKELSTPCQHLRVQQNGKTADELEPPAIS